MLTKTVVWQAPTVAPKLGIVVATTATMSTVLEAVVVKLALIFLQFTTITTHNSKTRAPQTNKITETAAKIKTTKTLASTSTPSSSISSLMQTSSKCSMVITSNIALETSIRKEEAARSRQVTIEAQVAVIGFHSNNGSQLKKTSRSSLKLEQTL